MDAVLPNGKLKVTGVIENTSWRERHEAQKRARIERMKDPALRAKYEARMQAKAEKEAEKQAAEETRINERVRKKVLAETYKQLGIEEDFIEQQKAWVAEQEANNPYGTDGLSAADHLKRTGSIAAGAGRAAGADKREIKDTALDFMSELAGEGSFKGLLSKGGTLGGTAIGATFGGPVGAAIGAVIGGLVVSIPMAVLKVKRKSKARDNNLADQAEKLETFKAELAEFENKINNLMTKLQADQIMLNEKYKTMKKAEFNEFLSTYISGALAEFGLTAGDIQKVADNLEPETSQEEAGEQGSKVDKEQKEDEVEAEAREKVDKEQSQQKTEEEKRKQEEARKQAEEQEAEANVQLGGE